MIVNECGGDSRYLYEIEGLRIHLSDVFRQWEDARLTFLFSNDSFSCVPLAPRRNYISLVRNDLKSFFNTVKHHFFFFFFYV